MTTLNRAETVLMKAAAAYFKIRHTDAEFTPAGLRTRKRFDAAVLHWLKHWSGRDLAIVLAEYEARLQALQDLSS